MKALCFDSNLHLHLRNKHPNPERTVGEALIRPTLMGVCNTDLEIIQGYMNYQGILGHEFVGIVEESDNPAWLGKRVCGDINAACGSCDTCLAGNQHHCPSRSVLGILNRNGAFADYLTLPEANLFEVPDNVSDEAAVFTEPLAAALEIPEQITINKNDPIIVLGDGKLGLLIAQALRLYSDNVLLLGRHAEKMALLEKSQKRSIKTAFSKDYHAPMSARIVVDATGSSEGLEKAINLVQPCGFVVLKSTVASPYTIDLSPLVIHEITMLGSRCGPFDKALAVLEKNQVDVMSLIGGTFSLDKGMDAMAKAGEKGSLKILISSSQNSIKKQKKIKKPERGSGFKGERE